MNRLGVAYNKSTEELGQEDQLGRDCMCGGAYMDCQYSDFAGFCILWNILNTPILLYPNIYKDISR